MLQSLRLSEAALLLEADAPSFCIFDNRVHVFFHVCAQSGTSPCSLSCPCFPIMLAGSVRVCRSCPHSLRTLLRVCYCAILSLVRRDAVLCRSCRDVLGDVTSSTKAAKQGHSLIASQSILVVVVAVSVLPVYTLLDVGFVGMLVANCVSQSVESSVSVSE